MHFDFTINAGQIAIVGGLVTLISVLLGFIWRIEVFSTWLLLEHEMLIEWYCTEHKIQPHELLTRKMRFWRTKKSA